MALTIYPITWQQGEDGEIDMIYKEGDPAVAVNLTGYSVRMDVSDGTTVLFSFNSEDFTGPTDTVGPSDNEATLGSDGSIHIVVPREVTISGALSTKVGTAMNYDVFLRNKTANTQKKILRGTITLESSVTLWA